MGLTLENIRKEYDKKVAVDNLSLDVPDGVLYGIIGPNGAGKTTTIRMIMNITIPDSGRILYDGHPVDKDFTRRVGYLPEERGLYKKMTIEDILVYMAALKGKKKSEVAPDIDRWLERVQLADYKERKVQELSKGMAQKLQFVSTILHQPDIIILDELFSGLDPLNIELIKDILLELKRDGRTILFSTHVMEQAEKLCDHICMISNGKNVVDGPLSQVKKRFGLNTLQIDIDGDGAFVREIPGVKKITDFNNYLEAELEDAADPQAILRQVIDRVNVRRFEQVEPSLYDIFIRLAKVDPSDIDMKKEAEHV